MPLMSSRWLRWRFFLHGVVDDLLAAGVDAVQEPAGQAHLADQLGPVPQVLVDPLGAGHVVGGLNELFKK